MGCANLRGKGGSGRGMAGNGRGITIVIVLCMAFGLAVMAVAALTYFQSQSRGLQQGVLRQRARYTANAGFNLAAGKLLRLDVSLKDRWYATGEGHTSTTFSETYRGDRFDVFVTDVFNDGDELDHVFVIARGTAGGRRTKRAIVFGAMRVVPGTSTPFLATILSKEPLDEGAFISLYEANGELFDGHLINSIARGWLDCSVAAYAGARESVIEAIRRRRLELLDFDDATVMKTTVALLMRHLELRATIQLARAYATLNRRSRLDKIMADAAGVYLSADDALSIIRSVYGAGGAAVSSEGCASLLSRLTRPQVELLVVFSILERIAAQPRGVEIEFKGTRYKPPSLALHLARLLYMSITGAACDFPSIAGIMHILLKDPAALARVNVLQHFHFLLGQEATFWWAGDERSGNPGPRDKQPFRGGAITLTRRFPHVDRRRLPFSPHSVDVTRDGRSGFEMLGGQGVAHPFWFQRLLSSVPAHQGLASTEYLEGIRRALELYLAGALADNGAAGLHAAAEAAGHTGLSPSSLYAFLDVADNLVDDADEHMLTLSFPFFGGDGSTTELGAYAEVWTDSEVNGTALSQSDYDDLMNETGPPFVANEAPIGELAQAATANGGPPGLYDPTDPATDPLGGNWGGHPDLDGDGFGTDPTGTAAGAGASQATTPSADVGYVGTGVEPPFAVDGNGTRIPEPPGGGLPADPADPSQPGGAEPTDPGGTEPTDPGGTEPTDPGDSDPPPPVSLPPIPTSFDPSSINDWLDLFRELGRQRPIPAGCSGIDDYVLNTLSVDQADWQQYNGIPLLPAAWSAVQEGSAEAGN